MTSSPSSAQVNPPGSTGTTNTELTNGNLPTRYPPVARVLHWVVAGAIVLQYLLGERAEEAAANNELMVQLAALAQHKSIGITVLALVLLRILWRFLQPPPPLPDSYTNTQPTLAKLATAMHVALYLLLLFLPLSGWLMSSASAYSVSWFGWVQLPDLLAPDTAAKDWLQDAHHLAAKVLLVLALVHIAAALKHFFIDKDELLGRMADPQTAALFVGTMAVGIWLTWPTSMPAAATTVPAPTPAPVSIAAEAAPESVPQPPPPKSPALAPTRPSLWEVDYERSTIEFTAEQAGAKFSGRWQRYAAEIRFDPEQLAASSATVRIAASSVATGDEERDTTLAGADWFDSTRFDTLVFQANEFSSTPTGFTAAATLEIRGTTYPITFEFGVQQTQSGVELTGQATLDRLALGLGVQEWADTEWVGQFVEVAVIVRGTR